MGMSKQLKENSCGNKWYGSQPSLPLLVSENNS